MQQFYKDVFGWGIVKIPLPGGGAYYIVHTAETDKDGMLQQKGAINGGLMERMKGQKVNTVIVISVPNVDEYVKKVEAKGGIVVMPKTQVMDMGLYARVTDTERNVIGIWQNLPKK